MSIRVIEWVLERSPVKHTGDRLVLVVLAGHARDDGTRAFPSVDTIGRKTRLSRRGVQNGLRRLVEAGAIEQTAPASNRNPSTYRVVMGELTATPNESQGRTPCTPSGSLGAHTVHPQGESPGAHTVHPQREPGAHTETSRGAHGAPEVSLTVSTSTSTPTPTSTSGAPCAPQETEGAEEGETKNSDSVNDQSTAAIEKEAPLDPAALPRPFQRMPS